MFIFHHEYLVQQKSVKLLFVVSISSVSKSNLFKKHLFRLAVKGPLKDVKKNKTKTSHDLKRRFSEIPVNEKVITKFLSQATAENAIAKRQSDIYFCIQIGYGTLL